MSNTSTVSPYAEPGSGPADVSTDAAVVVLGAAAGIAAVCSWLAEETAHDRAAHARASTARRRERNFHAGAPPAPPAISSVDLHLRDARTLLRAAERLGYRPERAVPTTGPLRDRAPILLRSAAGERLAIERTGEGRLRIHSPAGRERVHALVRQHTVERVAEHLTGRGMTVQRAPLAGGEVQLLAREQDPGRGGGAAVVKAEVRSDGTAWLDINQVRGTRCEQIVAGVAEAMGGEVCQVARKDAYFQLPGEPTRTRVKL